MTVITREAITEKLAFYLHHGLSLGNLIGGVESALMDGEFAPAHLPTMRDVVARIGVSDVRAFGQTWNHCVQLLTQLGYSAQVSIVAR